MSKIYLGGILLLVALVTGCFSVPAPITPTVTFATFEPSTTPIATATTTPTPTRKPTRLPTQTPTTKPPGLVQSGDGLAILDLAPNNKADDVDPANLQVAIRFNFPMVPVSAVNLPNTITQPLTIEPYIPFQGHWVNTFTYVMTPTTSLNIATHYTVTLQAVEDLTAQHSLKTFSWSFSTFLPKINYTDPPARQVPLLLGINEPISIHFNTAMDHDSVEQRFRLMRKTDRWAALGDFTWDETSVTFTPKYPLDYDTPYVFELAAGAQDAKDISSIGSMSTEYRTVKSFALIATLPGNGAHSTDQFQRGGGAMLLRFTQPPEGNHIYVTVVPTITHQLVHQVVNRHDDAYRELRVTGGWKASTAYTVTIGANTQSIYNETLSAPTVLHFTTAPIQPQLDVDLPALGLYDSNGPQQIFASATNISQVNYELFRVPRDELFELLKYDTWRLQENLGHYLPADQDLYRKWSQSLSTPLNHTVVISTTLADAVLNKPAAGVYLLRATTPQTHSIDKSLILVSPVNLALKYSDSEALVWVTQLATGKPVANQPISIYSDGGALLAKGKSNPDGVFRAPIDWKIYDYNAQLIALSESDKGEVIAAAAGDWDWGITPWEYDINGEETPRDGITFANLYTDRAIYRPGQTVYFKGVLRQDGDGTPSLPWVWQDVSEKLINETKRVGLTQIPATILNSRGEQILNQNLNVDEFGAVNGSITLNENAPTGEYRIQTSYGSVSFTVDEYRKPDFQVAVTTDKPEYLQGDDIHLSVHSSYFFGGDVSDADVTWRVLTEDYFAQPNIPGWWDFSNGAGYSYYDRYDSHNAEQISDGTGKTDATGVFTVTVPADLGAYTSSQNYTIEAEITDANHQAVSNRVTVAVHQGAFYVGLRSDSYVGTVNTPQTIHAVVVNALTIGDTPITRADQPIALSIYEGRWYNVRAWNDGLFEWQNTYSETLVSKTDLMTDGQGFASVTFTPTHAAEYRVEVSSQDERKNVIRAVTHLYVFGSEYADLKIDNTNRIELVTDKKEYDPGDTAKLLVLAPFANAEALLTIERGSIIEVQHLHLTQNVQTVSIPIRDAYAPNVFVSLMLVKGRGSDSQEPQFKMGYATLNVTSVEQTLKVSLDAHCYAPVPLASNVSHFEQAKEVSRPCQPQETATLTIHATDYQDRPVRAEFSIAMVDKAVQSLMGDNSTPLLSTFYQTRGLGVRTATTMIHSIERDNQTIRTGAKGGGGGSDSQSLIRRDFRDTAYWNPAIVTNAQGNAQVQIKLPDNLTTWNFSIKGITKNTLIGAGQTDLVSSRPLLIRPVTPRFLVVGDAPILEAVVNNNTNQAVTARVNLVAQGLILGEDATQTITVAAHDKQTVRWQTTTQPADQAKLTFTATSDTLRDGVELTLPIHIPQVTVPLLSVEPVETRLTKLIDFSSLNPNDSLDSLEIQLTPSLAAASRDALNYLESYNWECSEQTTSKFLPNVATYLAMQRLGMSRPDLFFSLQTNVSREVQRLYYLQHGDGGWGWWRDGDSRPALTAYALFALQNARTAGFAVDQDVMDRAEKYLDYWLDQPIDANVDYAYNERAFTLYVLTEMGRDTQGRIVNTFNDRDRLDLFAKGFLLLAMNKLNLPQQSQLVQELSQAAKVDTQYVSWHEKHQDEWDMSTDTRTQAIMIMALSRVDPKNPLLPRAVKWLMDARQLDYKAVHWDTTQETAWSVMALTEWMVASGELRGDYSYQVALNGEHLGDGTVNADNLDQTRTLQVSIRDALKNSANELLVTRSSTEGTLYTSAYIRKYVDPGTLAPVAHGIVVSRAYYAVDPVTLKPTTKLIDSANVGDYVQVKLNISLEQYASYLAVEDPLPAGFEAVDTSLQTSSHVVASPNVNPADDPFNEPYWWYWGHSEIRDDRVALFSEWMSKGTYEYSYVMRASVAGSFHTQPADAYEMYNPQVLGQSAGGMFTIRQ